MIIIQKEPNPSGAYPAPQTWDKPDIPITHAVIADTVDMTEFFNYNGFVILTIEDGVVTSYVPNVEAWEAWKAEQPEPVDPEPTEEEDTASMLIDHEFRLTMLELGLSE
jgi:hypothetical protein